MTPSDACINLCKQFEGLSLTPYLDITGIPTIGYGSTYYENGTKVTMQDTAITEDRAVNLLMIKLTGFAQQILNVVTTTLNQNQLDALTDFVYNLGFESFKGSTMLTYINNSKWDLASEEFPKWDHSGGVVVPGLLRRREAEQALFNS
jgi:lysozyme